MQAKVANLSPLKLYDKTRLGEENLQMLQETFSNTPSEMKMRTKIPFESYYLNNILKMLIYCQRLFLEREMEY